MRALLTAVIVTLVLAASQAWKIRANALYGTPAAASLPGFLFLFGGGTVIGIAGGIALGLVLRGVA